jgi:hypothetical protein
MTPAHIHNILNKGEGLTVEFKKATAELPKNLFETPTTLEYFLVIATNIIIILDSNHKLLCFF